ncbi:MAG TPA: trigger factor [Candidatus Acidoferrales bacterium]|nr:trigger factor [Candidatus Acidoferrales bacterium]
MTDIAAKGDPGAQANSGMTVSLERKAASQVALQVEATPAEVDAAIEASLRRLASRVRIPGFRPGKAPAAMVERAVGWETVRHETVDHLVPDLYLRAVEEVGVEPIGDPDLDLGELERDKPLKFTATVTVKPEVDLRDYLSLRVPMETTEITDANVDEAIMAARRTHAELVEVDRAAQAGDVIKCILVMRRGDEILTGGDNVERDLELNREEVIPAIVDGVIGLTAGQSRTFETVLPQDYRQEELRGAAVTIDVSVHAVRERELPPEDDSLAVLDGHGTTLDELREYYRTTLAAEAVEQDREAHEGAALEALRDHVRVDVPQPMIDREIDRQLADLEYRLGSLGLPLDRYLEMSGSNMEALRTERRDAAASRVRLELALDALAVAEGIEVDENQVQREARAVAEGRRMDASQRKRLEDIARRDLRRRAAGERLLEIVTPEGSGFVST